MRFARSTFLALAAAALAKPAAAEAQSQLIRIGTTPNDSYAEPLYAKDEGFFEAAGLNCDVQDFSNGAGVTTALGGNALDVGITNGISLANAVEHGVPFEFFAAAGTYNREEVALVVAPDSPYHEAKDLNGKTFGTSAIKDANSLHIVAWMDKNGGDSSSIQLVEVPFSAMVASVKRGTIAAAPMAEPALTGAKAQGLRVIGHPIDLEMVKKMNRAPYGLALTPNMLQPYLDLGYKYKFLGEQLKAADLIAKL